MLAPGEYLIKQPEVTPAILPGPSNPTPLATPAAPLSLGRTAQSARPALPPSAEEPEPRSFLLTLLRALGAVHT